MKDKFISSNTQYKQDNLFILLCAIFIANVIIAEIIGVKIFSLEILLNISPVQIDFFETHTLDFNLTAGALIWPIVFLTTDIINEYFGKKGVKKVSLLSAGLMVYIFIAIWIASSLPPAQLWIDLYQEDSQGNFLNINEAFKLIFRQGLGIIIGSLTAFFAWTACGCDYFSLFKKTDRQ